MKKMVSVSLMIVALNASANFGNGPWSNNGWNNGFIAHNPYSMFTPDWFSEEMDDMMDEFDSNNTPWRNNNNFNNQRPWNNNYGPMQNRNWNQGPWNNNSNPMQNRNWNQGPWGNSQPFNFRNNSFGPMNNGPWNNTNRSVQPTTK
ncbi:hypothetical protein CRYPA_1048 [uncultured Candidatus Thioglobus sp.]|nr:hypothetical protein CRYPA_1048 [uncultured Candidatus Thioglobus sp.]